MPHSGIRDDGVRFQIVPSTRKITVPASHKVIGAVGDHLSEQLTFQVPLTIDAHAITGCKRKYVTWKNVNGGVGTDELKLSSQDDEYAYFTWSVRDALTVGSGIVQFSVHFEDTEGDTMLYRWSTAPCKDCEILDSVNALLGTYKAMWVNGDTLVIGDYTPVVDSTLELNGSGFTPEGTLEITKNGEYDVGLYATANVAVDPPTGTINITTNGEHNVTDYATANVAVPFDTPTITVTDGGVITATANGMNSELQLGATHDADFVAANIKHGVTIFGVEGSCHPEGQLLNGNIQLALPVSQHTQLKKYGYAVTFYGATGDEAPTYKSLYVNWYNALNIKVVANSPVILAPVCGDDNFPEQTATATAVGLGKVLDYAGCFKRGEMYNSSGFVFMPIQDNFTIEMHVPEVNK